MSEREFDSIPLDENQSVYKISMSPNTDRGFDDNDFAYFCESNRVVVHGETPKNQGEVFFAQIKIGDYFYLCRGNNYCVLIGKITSDAEACTYKDFGRDSWLQRSYEIIAKAKTEGRYEGGQKGWTPNYNSTCYEINKKEIEDANTKIFTPFFGVRFEMKDAQITSKKENNPNERAGSGLNIILFGPPGTGKTYNAINKALEIMGEDLTGKSRKEIKALFDSKVNEGRIEFTTFHQSMSYEDFIEGIKPDIETESNFDSKQVSYKIRPGIFYKLCVRAGFSSFESLNSENRNKIVDFAVAYDIYFDEVNDKILSGETVNLDTVSGSNVVIEGVSGQGNFIVKHKDGTVSYTVSKARLLKLQSEIKDLADVSNVNSKFRAVIGGCNSSAYWAVLNAIRIKASVQSGIEISSNESKEIDPEVQRRFFLDKLYCSEKAKQPYVLIIDEINRGNVAQIFGELITLIEEDKRLGEPEELRAVLPYSQDKFGVPSNLYIIGTMNTADRSVEAIDTALRRRFCFEEMPSRPDLIAKEGILKEKDGVVENISLETLLEKINSRIEVLLDKDHHIGHSYFMSVSDLDDLKLVFKNKIIPLLQEYFFGDHGKIGLVLGKGFIEQKNSGNIFADFDDYDTSGFESKFIYEIKNPAKMENEVFISALNKLLKND
jgi:5-methylcytosine-specific restriction protein B